MPELIRLSWETTLDSSGLPRRDRQPCMYEAYLPDPLAGRQIHLEGSVAAEVADAERAIVKLNNEAAALVNTEILARILLRAESVASSRIEGLEVGGRRLVQAEFARNLGDPVRDVTADESPGQHRCPHLGDRRGSFRT